MVDTVPGNNSSAATLIPGIATTGTVDAVGDHDWYRVTLIAGQIYTFTVNGPGSATLFDSILDLRDDQGQLIVSDDDGGQDHYSQLTFQATASGTYFLDVSGWDDSVGTFSVLAVNAAAIGADTIAADTATSGAIAIGGTVNGVIDNIGDHDWYAVNLTAGQRYSFFTSLLGVNDDVHSTLSLRDSSGQKLSDNGNLSSNYISLYYTPTTSGTYYIDVEGLADTSTGAYRLSAAATTTVTVHAGGPTIILYFDAASSASTTAATNFRASIAQAASTLSATFYDDITLSFNINYTGTGGGAFAAPRNGVSETYADVAAALRSHAIPGDTIFDHLPTSISPTAQVDVFSAEAKALGLMDAHDTSVIDGEATFSTDIPAGNLVGLAMHELTHAMGRADDGNVDIFDMFRYTAAGSILVSGGKPSPAAYFSVDGGVTRLADYDGVNSPSDFLNSGVQGSHDLLNEFYNSATLKAFSAVDLLQLDALGFHVHPPNHDPVFTAGGIQTIAIGDAVTTAIMVAATDADNDQLVYSISNPNLGVLTGSAGAYLYTPKQNFSGTDNLVVTVSDGYGGMSVQRINITLTPIHITGDAQDNGLSGNSAANIIDGGAGADFMQGGDGDDTYYVDNVADFIFEFVNAGYDTVFSSVSYSLSDSRPTYSGSDYIDIAVGIHYGQNEIERLILTGSTDLSASGNSVANKIEGNSGNNLLQGLAGNDTLIGGAGNDTLDGGADADIAVFSGNRADYRISHEGQGFRLIDQRAGANDGNDLAVGIETFQFADANILASDLVPPPPVFTAGGSQTVATAEDVPTAVSALATSSNYGSLTWSITTSPTHGTLGGSAGAYTYTPAANYNGSDSFVVSVSDGSGQSVAQTVSLTISAVNDAPVNTVPATQTTNQDVAKVITGLLVSDVDAGSGPLTVTLSVDHGAITLGIPSGGVNIAGNSSASVTLTGTVIDINATLAAANAVTYTPASGYNGSDTLHMTVSDNGNSGPGGALSDTDTVGLQIAPPPIPLAQVHAGESVGLTGHWSLFGDGGSQTITVNDHSNITFRSGFNAGTMDSIRLTGHAADFSLATQNISNAVLTSIVDDISVTVPIGANGVKLIFDNDETQTIGFVGGILNVSAVQTVAGASNVAAISPTASVAQLHSGESIGLSGRWSIFGDSGVETVTVGDHSNVIFRSGFNAGTTDTVRFTGQFADFHFSAQSISNAVLTSTIDDIAATIPIGANGINVQFDNGASGTIAFVGLNMTFTGNSGSFVIA